MRVFVVVLSVLYALAFGIPTVLALNGYYGTVGIVRAGTTATLAPNVDVNTIGSVAPGSPAARAGIVSGDVAVPAAAEHAFVVQRLFNRVTAGRPIPYVVIHNGQRRIVMRHLVKRYGARSVVNRVTADVRTGEIVGLLGPNGAGKTTTFYMVVGLVKPDEGSVALESDGVEIDLTGEPMYQRARQGIGYLAQENSIFRKLSVGDNIRLIWEMNGVSRREQERRLPDLLD